MGAKNSQSRLGKRDLEETIKRLKSMEELRKTREGTIQELRESKEISEVIARAFIEVSRESFVHPRLAKFSYWNCPLPIGYYQTISQPRIVLRTLYWLEIEPTHKVLEIGAGSGYNAALLGNLAQKVISTEIIPELGAQARERIKRLGIKNVSVVDVDRHHIGHRNDVPYDRIVVTATAPEIPRELVEQLAANGVMIIPVLRYAGDARELFNLESPPPQVLYRVRKDERGRTFEDVLITCNFVPLQYGNFPILERRAS